MTNQHSPIMETHGKSPIVPILLLFLLFGLTAFYFFSGNIDVEQRHEQTAIPEAQPSSPPTPTSTADMGTHQSKSAHVLTSKMNVFYIGVENPIEISVAGVPSAEVRVSIAGGGATISKKSGKNYIVKVTRPTADCKITISADGFNHTQEFRVKRLPDPVAQLGGKTDGSIGTGEFKAQKGLVAWLHNFDFEAKCQIQGFEFTKQTEGKKPQQVINRGGRFSEESQQLVQSAKPGDMYLFTRVKTRCPGDAAGRKINSLVFRIK